MHRNVANLKFLFDTRELSLYAYIEELQWVAGRVKHGEQDDWEEYQDERLHVKEYQREEQIVTAVFDQQGRQELFRELDARQALVEPQRRSRGIRYQHFVECTLWWSKIKTNVCVGGASMNNWWERAINSCDSPEDGDDIAQRKYYRQDSRDPQRRLDLVLQHVILHRLNTTRLIIIICRVVVAHGWSFSLSMDEINGILSVHAILDSERLSQRRKSSSRRPCGNEDDHNRTTIVGVKGLETTNQHTRNKKKKTMIL